MIQQKVTARRRLRWLRDPKLNFPQPTYIRGRRFWDAAELDAFDGTQRGAGAA